MNKKHLIPLIIIFVILTLACNFLVPETAEENNNDAQPEIIPTAEAMATDVAPVSRSDNACNNIFYPLLPKQQMVYKTTSPEGSTQMGITVAKVDGNFATIDMVDMSTGIVTQSTVECDAGMIKHFPAISIGTILGDMLDGEMTMKYVSGYIAPTEDMLKANNWDMSWESKYIMSGEIVMEDEGESVTISIDDSPVSMKWQTEGVRERITVEAGTYSDAIKVTREMTLDVSIDMGIMKLDSVLTINSTHWFEPYIGMVKMEFNEVSVQMQGATFPITLSETMELVEFRPAE